VETAWSSAGDLAVLVNEGSALSDIHLLRPPDFVGETLTVAASVSRMRWSPAGVWLAFSTYSGAQGTSTTAVSRRDGSSFHDLELPGAFEGNVWPAGWFSDTRLLLVSQSGVTGTLLEFDLDSSLVRKISDVPVYTRSRLEPIVSPDVLSVLVPTDAGACGYPGGPESLELVDVQSGNSDVVVAGSCSVETAAWSPDGATVAYSVIDVDSGRGGLYVVDLATLQPRRLLEQGFHRHLRWSSDGATIVGNTTPCYGCSPGSNKWLSVDLATGATRDLADGASTSLSTDQALAAFVAEGVVHMTDLVSGEEKVMPTFGPAFTAEVGDWQPGTSSVLVKRSPATGAASAFTVNLDGTGLTAHYWPGPGQAFFTRDGTRLAVLESSEGEVAGNLALLDADGSNRLEIPLAVTWVSWSPAANMLVAFGQTPGNPGAPGQLFPVKGTGEVGSAVAIEFYRALNAVWSPDETKIAFTGDGLLILDLASGVLTTVFSESLSTFALAAWSVDSSKIVLSGGPGAQGDIHIVNSDGTGMRRLTSDTAPEFGPSMSPDGGRIAFRRSGPGRIDVVILDLASGEQQVIFDRPIDGGGGDSAVWSSGGEQVAFFAQSADGQGIYAINADGTGLYRLATGVGQVADLYWLSDDRVGFATRVGGM
jgi:Tol biopolymer transport system component